MLYEMAIRLDDGQTHKLLYDTETEWLWFAANGRPYISLVESMQRKALNVKVPDNVRRFAQRA